MIESYSRGHKIEHNGDEWVYSDKKEPVEGSPRRPCNKCEKPENNTGYDSCIGQLPAPVKSACCGHGKIEECYILFHDGDSLRGESAVEWIKEQNK